MVYYLVQTTKRMSCSEPGGILPKGGSRISGRLSPSERLEKIIFELLETEKAYVEVIEHWRTFFRSIIVFEIRIWK